MCAMKASVLRDSARLDFRERHGVVDDALDVCEERGGEHGYKKVAKREKM